MLRLIECNISPRLSILSHDNMRCAAVLAPYAMALSSVRPLKDEICFSDTEATLGLSYILLRN